MSNQTTQATCTGHVAACLLQAGVFNVNMAGLVNQTCFPLPLPSEFHWTARVPTARRERTCGGGMLPAAGMPGDMGP